MFWGILSGCLLMGTPLTQERPTTVQEPTRALFRYQREDNTPGKATQVQINAERRAAAPISPRIFGNFMEHLGGAIYETVWAQPLLNPNLERIEGRETRPSHWELEGNAAWQPDGYRSPLCVRLRPKSEQQAVGTLGQTFAAPHHRVAKYTLYLYVRAPQAKGQIVLTITGIEDKAKQVLAQTTLTAERDIWRKLAFPFTLSKDTLAKGERVRVRVAHAEGGPVDVDQVEVFPEDHFLGLDMEVVRKAREWQIPLLRWPGGNFASGYRWQDGLGLRETRPTRRNLAWGGIESNHFGINEFIKYCRLLRAEPQLTVNAGDGTPEEAAAWVHYCNSAPSQHPEGLRRASNGSPEDYEVKLWEVGNELYGSWQIGHTDAKGNAERYVRFRDAMLTADPEITLIATGKGDEFTPEGRKRNQEWNEALLRAATANGGKAPDFLSLHPLVPLPERLDSVPYADQYASAMAHPTFLGETLLPEVAAQIAAVVPKGKTQIAVTEWGIIVGGAKWRESPNHDTLAGAIFNALTLNALLRNSDVVTLANMTAFSHGGGIKRARGVVYVDPQFYTQQLYAAARLHTPVEVATMGPGQNVPARGHLPAVSNVPDVDVFAALNTEGKRLVVFAINRHLTETRRLDLTLAGFTATTLSAQILTAPDTRTGNSPEAPDTVRPQPFSTPAWPAPAGMPWQVLLPPHALVVFTFLQ